MYRSQEASRVNTTLAPIASTLPTSSQYESIENLHELAKRRVYGPRFRAISLGASGASLNQEQGQVCSFDVKEGDAFVRISNLLCLRKPSDAKSGDDLSPCKI